MNDDRWFCLLAAAFFISIPAILITLILFNGINSDNNKNCSSDDPNLSDVNQCYIQSNHEST